MNIKQATSSFLTIFSIASLSFVATTQNAKALISERESFKKTFAPEEVFSRTIKCPRGYSGSYKATSGGFRSIQTTPKNSSSRLIVTESYKGPTTWTITWRHVYKGGEIPKPQEYTLGIVVYCVK